MNSNKAIFFSGIKWSMLAQVGNQIGNYLTIVLLSLQLSPEDFGLITLSTLLVGLAEILNGFGAGQWIISQHITEERKINEMMGNTLVLSFGLLLVCALLAVPFTRLYGEGAVFLSILLVSASSLPINALHGILNDIQAQQLQFKRLSAISLSTLAIGNVVAILAAFGGLGVWALVIKNLLPALISLAALLYFSPYRFRPRVKWTGQNESKTFQWHFSLFNVLNYFSRNLDYLIIGLFFNHAILGQYSIAYKIMLLPLKNLSSKVNSILFPLLSKQGENAPKVLSTYLKVIEGISFLVFPLMALIGLTAGLWVPIFFDVRYNLLPQIIEVLAMVGAFQAITSPIGSLFLIQKQTQKMLQISVVSIVVLGAAFLLGAYTQDIVWFAFIYGVAYVAFIFPLSNAQGLRLFEGTLKHFFKAIYIPLLSILPFFIVIPVILKQEISAPILLLFSGMTAAVFYLALTLWLSQKSVAENVRHFKSVFSQLAR